MIAAVVVVAVGLAAGGAVLLILLNRTLVASVDASALARANAVGRLLADRGPAAVRTNLADNPPVGQVVQVIGAEGSVVASSSTRSAQRPLSRLRPAPGRVDRSEVDRVQLLDIDDPYLFLARGVRRDGQTFTVLVASSIKAARESVQTVFLLLAISAPVLLALVGVATWILVGRSLAPVERIRARVAGIGGTELGDRVPVPASGDEITRLATTMNAMLDRLQRSNTVQRQFVSDASHELRSPVATLAAALEVSGADVAAGVGWGELREVMGLETSRMARLVDDLLLLARSDDEGMIIRSGDVDLDDLVLDETARVRLAGRVTVTSSPNPARVHGDVARISQLLRNLADNAVRHADSRVRLTARLDGDRALLVVEDDGPGIPEGDRDRAFDRFVRLEGSRDRGSGGSGLGLAIVREIARAHGATVGIDTSELSGARVTVSFPAVGQDASDPAVTPAAPGTRY